MHQLFADASAGVNLWGLLFYVVLSSLLLLLLLSLHTSSWMEANVVLVLYPIQGQLWPTSKKVETNPQDSCVAWLPPFCG